MTEKQLGDDAEKFFNDYERYLVKTMSRIFSTKVNYVEGQDRKSLDISFRTNGNVEVKAIRNFLTRDNDGQGYDGTISFEIFHGWPNPKKNNLTFGDLYAGWLLSAYHPEEYCQMMDLNGNYKRAVRPGVYAFILYDSQEKPFASVVFENVPALLNRLRILCPDETNWGIDDLRKLCPATNRAYWGQYQTDKGQPCWIDQRRGCMIWNMWHVPFAAVCDLATVTMIGDNPNENGIVAAGRYNYLQQCAAIQGRGACFYPTENNKEKRYSSVYYIDIPATDWGKTHTMIARDCLDLLPYPQETMADGWIHVIFPDGLQIEVDPDSIFEFTLEIL